MTDELKNFDEEVRRAYRDIASERTPDALDKAVLRQARKAVRPGYARLRAWTRPVAWAATVALCVAVVLEVGRLPETPAVPVVEGSMHQPVLDEAATPDAKQVEKREAPESGRFAPTATKADVRTTVPARARERHAAEEAAADQRPSPVGVLSEDLPATAVSADPDLQDSVTPEHVRGLLRAQESAAGPAFFDLEEPCPPEVREKPDAWAACIRALENAGLDDAASEQRRRLREAFPDFDLR